MGIKEFHAFSKSICLKVNVIAQLEFQLVYFEAAVLHFNSLYHSDSAFYS